MGIASAGSSARHGLLRGPKPDRFAHPVGLARISVVDELLAGATGARGGGATLRPARLGHGAFGLLPPTGTGAKAVGIGAGVSAPVPGSHPRKVAGELP